MANEIRYIKHEKINFNKWDQLVQEAEQGTVYSYSWWLSAFSAWDIIILDDYKAGIAVPIKSIVFGKKVYQPNFVQQCLWLGAIPDTDLLASIAKLIASNSSLAHFNSNLKLNFKSKARVNQILHIGGISDVRTHYSKSLTKNIKKHKHKVTISESKDIQLTIDKYIDAYGSLNKQLGAKDYTILKSLVFSHPKHFVNLMISLNGQLVAGLLFAKGKNRIHYILGAPSSEGRKVNALSIGIDYIIERYGGSYPILDFEGSSIPSVYKFYKSFGAEVEEFSELEYISRWMDFPLKVYRRLFKS